MAGIILYALFILVPFGELLFLNWYGIRVRFVDVVVTLGVVALLYSHKKKLPFTLLSLSPLAPLAAALLASALVNVFVFTTTAWLYLIRTGIYFLFFALLTQTSTVRPKHMQRFLLIGLGLLVVSCIAQYFFYSNLRNLLYAGYDPHMGRIVGPFLDPNLLGLALVWYIIALLPWSVFYLGPVLLLTLLTYSRISILVGLLSMGYWYTITTKRWVVTLLASIVVIGIVLLLPRTEGIGTDIWRSNSVVSKPEAFKKAVGIGKRNILFGIGFNRLASEHSSQLPYPDNSQFGIDNTLFTLFATTGLIGIWGYIGTFVLLWKTYASSTARALTLAFFVHSLSVNSFFTPTLFLLYTLLIFYTQSSLRASSHSRQHRSPQPL